MLAYLDIIGSLIIGGLMFLAVFRMDAQLLDRSVAANLALISQTNGANSAEVVESHLRRIGLSVPPGTPPIIAAHGTGIRFRGDVDTDPTDFEVVRIFQGTPNSDSSNPNDYRLARVVDGVSQPLDLGATVIAFTFYDENGSPTTTLEEIQEIELRLRIETPEPYRYWDEAAGGFVEMYPGNEFHIRVRPKNL